MSDNKKTNYIAVGIALGTALGAGIGVAADANSENDDD